MQETVFADWKEWAIESCRIYPIELLLQGVGYFVTAQVAACDGVSPVKSIGMECDLHSGNEVIHTQRVREVLGYLNKI
jgi:hypothetical protein